MSTPILSGRRPIMALYSGVDCLCSHGCRIVLVEKDVECQLIFIEPGTTSEELAELNPYHETPTLLDRDLVLYGTQIINEYLDERLPHPPLMPVDPVNRGRARLMIRRIEREWITPALSLLEDPKRKNADAIRNAVRDGLIAMSAVFDGQPHMMGDEFSLVDCSVAPLLWRLPVLGIELPRQARPMLEYAERLFARPGFIGSLTEVERDLR